tara:strand:- start:8191 stop:8904 length:714 start_codon:yes stop_codon:yes gene_type:complete
MCLIITKTSNGKVCWASADRSALSNPNGYGVAYAEDGEAKFLKSMKWSDVRRKAKELESNGAPFIIHQRLATHGASTKENCHPFTLSDHGLVMAHNGIISSLHVPAGMSDSRVLAKYLNDSMPEGFLTDEDSREHVTELMEGYSKLSFIDGHGNVFFINEELGKWHDGCWYSVPYAVQDTVAPAYAYDPRKWRKERKTKSRVVTWTRPNSNLDSLPDHYGVRRGRKLTQSDLWEDEN